MKAMAMLMAPPAVGQEVAWTSRDDTDPEVWFVERSTPTFTRITDRLPRPGTRDHQRRSFCVPTDSLMAWIETTRPAARRAAPSVSSSRPGREDPPGLSSATTTAAMAALAESIGMPGAAIQHMVESMNTAPNNGQRVMRGRNAIRNYWRKQK